MLLPSKYNKFHCTILFHYLIKTHFPSFVPQTIKAGLGNNSSAATILRARTSTRRSCAIPQMPFFQAREDCPVAPECRQDTAHQDFQEKFADERVVKNVNLG
ncbi:hypothetical protein CDAR_82291 [Caerostris darwini]|uniref:Uncharacterized protein n=1 Tax=Caerostris darwini TaxID=1538125 RepID=A0AAV4QCK7_9ARAC|nr:hypothetical protein CDAR_82291 [Caerostris darwini]